MSRVPATSTVMSAAAFASAISFWRFDSESSANDIALPISAMEDREPRPNARHPPRAFEGGTAEPHTGVAIASVDQPPERYHGTHLDG